VDEGANTVLEIACASDIAASECNSQTSIHGVADLQTVLEAGGALYSAVTEAGRAAVVV